MEPSADEDRFALGIAASDAGRLAEAHALLLPLAEAGHPEAQGAVGSLMQYSLYRFENIEQAAASGVPTVDEATALADRDQAGRYLRAASEAGIGPASFNLAGLVIDGYGGGSWEERKAWAAELYALAYEQGFTAFGHLMNGQGPGQPYLDILERYAEAAGIPPPGEPNSGG